MRQEELRAQNKQRVLDEALKCFYYEGIERTKVATIAQKAGVTSMSVYRYYGDKENIVLNRRCCLEQAHQRTALGGRG